MSTDLVDVSTLEDVIAKWVEVASAQAERVCQMCQIVGGVICI